MTPRGPRPAMQGKRLLAGLLAAALLAGCVAQPAPEPAPVEAPAPEVATPPAFRLEGAGCLVGGGHSVHSQRVAPFIIPEPWKVADILADVGPQLIYPEEPADGVPSEGNTWGNWHVTVTCDAWMHGGEPLDGLVFGFVSAFVEPPPFDDGTAVKHAIVTVLATSDHAMHEAFHDAGFHATLTTGYAEYPAPGLFHHLLDTEDHGVYESLYRTTQAGEAPQGMLRLWWQHENDDATFSPYALDIAMSGGKHLWAEPNGYFSHLRTHDHDPLPGAAGDIAGLNWEGVDLVITLGPRRDDVRLPEAYLHV